MLKVLDHLEEWIITLLMGAATTIIFFAVLHRYASGWPIPGLQDALLRIDMGWAQELCIYMFVWMAKFGAAYGVRTGIHVGVDVLVNRLEDKTRAKLILVGLLGGVIFTGIVGSMGARFVWALSHTEQVSPDMELPMWIVYLAVPLGSYLMCFRFLQVIGHFWRSGELPHHDHGHVDGIEDETQTLAGDANEFALDDEMHPHDMKHHHFVESHIDDVETKEGRS
ncbi:MAG: C4-dicarboxylate ABC transporter permease [Desulfobulbaceae bacterium A2]|nr:MAG: C4-dicarboxylate ABC transporter permease [Desulfobulbaceae bacterium A2]